MTRPREYPDKLREKALRTAVEARGHPTRPGVPQMVAWGVAGAALVTLTWVTVAGHSARPYADVDVYWGAIRERLSTGSFYSFRAGNGDRFTYPPVAGLLLRPWASLGLSAAGTVWLAMSVCSLLALAFAASKASLGGSEVLPDRLGWMLPALIALLAVSRPAYSNLGFGQVSLALTALVAVDVLVLAGRRGQGVLIGLCSAVKLTPALFIPYLWFSGRRRAAVVAAVTFAAASVVGALIAPRDSATFWGHELLNTGKIEHFAGTGNQSLQAVLVRAGFGPGWAAELSIVLAVAVGVIAVRRASRVTAIGNPLTGLVVVGCATVVISPVSWTHHLFWLVLAVACPIRGPRSARWAWALLVAATVVVTVPPPHWPLGLGWPVTNSRFLIALLISTCIPLPSDSAKTLVSAAPVDTSGAVRTRAGTVGQ